MRILLAPLLVAYWHIAAAMPVSLPEHSKRDVCNDSTLGYFVTPDAISGDQAFGYCQSLGGRLADVNAHNVGTLTAFINDCLGPSSRIRIQTWDTNTFGTSSLAMFTGPFSGYGTVNIAANDDALYALCAMVRTEIPAPPVVVNSTFLAEPEKVQIPGQEEEDDEQEDEGYDFIHG
ncbi:hypothetical protein [Parasitella parasitica]|uniref:C-type lectin domain-containing protein n=1 Tax=Parasitella parasitica TaxID=35722 RepID=A0A0B7N9W8_9FUNG|nr:hypothetical protein [Parasitella parasitica]